MAVSNVELIVDAVKAINPLRRTDAAAKKLEGTMARAKSAIQNLSGVVDKAGRQMTTAFGKAKQSAKAFTAEMTSVKGAVAAIGIVGLTKSVVSQAAKFEQTKIRLMALSKEYGEFDDIQKLIASNAKTFNQSQAEASNNFSDVYARLRPLGISLNEIQTVYKGFNATALASGTSAAAASGAFLQLSQALGSGRLQGDEFRSVAEQVPGILRLVADEMKVTVGELKKLGSDGKITSDVLINALAKGFEENKDKIQEILALSPAAKFKKFENSLSELSNTVGSELLPVFIPMVEEATKLLKVFGDLPEPAKKVTIGIGAIGVAAVIAVPAVVKLGVALKAIAASQTVAILGTLAAKIGLVGGALAGLAIMSTDAARRQEEFNEVTANANVDQLASKVDELTAAKERMQNRLEAIEGGPWYRGMQGDIESIKGEIDLLSKQIDEATRRRSLIIDIVTDVRSKAIKGFDQLTDAQVQEALAMAGVTRRTPPKSLGGRTRTGKTEAERAAEAAEKAAKKAAEKRLELERSLTFEAIEQSNNVKTIIEDRQTENELLQLELDKGKEFADTTRSINELVMSGVPFSEAFKLVEANQLIAEQIKKQKELQEAQKAAAAEMDQLYGAIGDSIKTGVVDSLTAAVEGTKSLAEVASDTLRSLANILLKFGVQTALAGLGGGNQASIFTKLFGGGRASGGTVKGGTSYLVGERGPELFTPGRSGSIAPNNAFGSSNIVVNVDASGSNAQGNGQNAKQLGAAIGAAVQAELIKQQRPGGLLAR